MTYSIVCLSSISAVRSENNRGLVAVTLIGSVFFVAALAILYFSRFCTLPNPAELESLNSSHRMIDKPGPPLSTELEDIL